MGAEKFFLERRELGRGTLISVGLLITGFDKIGWTDIFATPDVDSFRGGTQLGTVDFSDEGSAPMEQVLGSELDGRLFTDLSKLTSTNSVNSTDMFYIRTRASKLLDNAAPWTIELGGMIEKPITISTQSLQKMTRPMGLHLMECAGNSRSAHFGMLSVADWDGVPLQEILEKAKFEQPGRVLISGFDRYAAKSWSSIPGASWVFTVDELISSRAFLATKMNGQPLSADHGAPVRLVVPGWYGCTCIKWVNEISHVAEDAEATSQMREYASRTMQSGVPQLAKDYKAAVIDAAAVPIRIEKWLVGGRIRFRVAGIQWGGPRAAEGLEIQFNPNEDYVPVTNLQVGVTGSWNFWSQAWTPQKPGKYLIRLRLRGRTVQPEGWIPDTMCVQS